MNSIRLVLLILSLGLMPAQTSHGCSCFNGGKFTKYSESASIVRGAIQRHGPQFVFENNSYPTMTVLVSEVVRGNYSNSNIVFIGDSGVDCFAPITANIYPINSEHLFAVFAQSEQQVLNGCGEVSVSIVDGEVNGGFLREGKWWRKSKWIEYSLDYDKFLQMLK